MYNFGRELPDDCQRAKSVALLLIMQSLVSRVLRQKRAETTWGLVPGAGPGTAYDSLVGSGRGGAFRSSLPAFNGQYHLNTLFVMNEMSTQYRIKMIDLLFGSPSRVRSCMRHGGMDPGD